jgi:hypothetical protein
MKTEVYSWRVSAELKTGLQREARRRRVSMAKLLETAAVRLLDHSDEDQDEKKERARLMEAARKCFGTIEAEPDLAETSGKRIKEILKMRNEAERAGR